YQHSSWYSMMLNVLSLVPDYLSDEGVFLTAIDDFEIHELSLVTDLALGRDNRLGVLVVEIKPSGRTNDNFLATCHEYYLCYSRNSSCVQINFFELDEEQKQQYSLQDGVSDYKWRDFLRTGGYSTPRERPNSFYPIFFNPKTNQISLEASAEFIEILPIDSSGKERVWRKTRPSFQNHVESGDIMIKQARSDDYKVYIKDRIKSGVRPKSVWIGSKYDAASHGTKLIKSMMGPDCPFSFPKSLYAVMDIMKMVTSDNEESFDVVLDFFAGSGTTAHAVIQQNQIDDGNRKYILVERAEYIYSVLIPRIKKAIYSKDWKEGKPGSRKGSSQLFKYIRLESYEDTLNNLELKRTSEQDLLLAQYQPFRESYMLSYMLDVESKGSPSLLNIEQFEDPFNYKLNISTGSAGETKPVNVDLVETFNYLIGLTVQHIDHIRGFRVVQGTNPKGEKVLIIWRNLKEKSNNDLEEFFRRQEYNPRDMEFDLIYINGDNNLENIKRPDETWKVRLIEEDFMRLMFDVEDV
ncbi:MAG: DNA methyltransferase, partial [Proteobacteria bacterium]|nr:DNA methyltransferase [Pseudomonadota bacterium]